MKYLFVIILFLVLASHSEAQLVKVVAEEWSIYNDSLGEFETQGEQLVMVEFDRDKMQVRVSHGEYITRTYSVHSIEDKEVDGETALYWNLYDPDYLRIAFVPDMIMFIDHDKNKAMVLTKLTYLDPG